MHFRRIRRPLPIIIILLLALLVRLAGITWGLPAPGRHRPWTVDEMTFLACVYRMDPLRLNLNPGYFKTPSFTVYLLAASLIIGAAFGWVKLTHDPTFYIQHMDQRGNMFLIGRLNSVVFAVLSVGMLYLLVRRLYTRRPRWVALLAVALLAILPGHVTWSHYLSQHPLVTFWVLLTFYLLLRLMEDPRPRWYLLSGLSTGIATSTNYSGALLFALLFLAHFLTADGRWRMTRTDIFSPLRWQNVRWLALAFSCALFGFLLATPAALLDIHFFWDEFMWEFHAVQNVQHDGWWTAIRHVMGVILPAGLGWCLYLLGMAGLVWLSFRRRWRGGEALLLAWMYLYLFLTIRAGSFATTGRVLPLLVFFPILLANFLFELQARWPRSKHLTRGLGIVALLATAVSTFFVDSYFLTDTVRSDASAWVLERIPPGSSIGLLETPSWFSPDIIATDCLHPEATGGIYQYVLYYHRADLLREQPAEYVVVSSTELDRPGETKEELLSILRQEYEPIMTFSTRLGLPPFWPRDHILANGLLAPPDIIILERIGPGR